MASVDKQNVSFHSSGLKLAGHMYVPNDAKCKLPAIVTVSPWSSVKEQTTAIYARKLAEQGGFVALAFDHRHYGESEGEPRCYENPAGKVEDISSAIDFLQTHHAVDPERIGIVGICAGGSYLSEAAALDRRVKAVATITGVTDLRGLMLNDLKMGQEGLIKLLQAASAARKSEAEGNPAQLLPLISRDNSAKGLPAYVGNDAVDYYYDPKRGATPTYRGEVALSSYLKTAASSAVLLVPFISPTPYLIIGGTKSDSRHFQEEAYAAAQEPKELVLLEGLTHNDLYDVESATQAAADKLLSFFKNNLDNLGWNASVGAKIDEQR